MRLLRPSDFTIATKGLVLLAIPFIFELAIVGTLWTMFDDASERAKNIAVSREIIVKLGHLSATLMQSSEAVLMYNFKAKPSDLETYKRNRDDINNTLNALEKIFAKNHRERAMLESLRRSTTGIDETLGAHQIVGDSAMERIKNCGIIRNELQEKSQQFRQAVSAITNVEKVAEDKNMVRERASRDRMRTLLICAFCLSLFIAISLSLFFYKNIVSRINTLKENSKLLGEGKPIVAPISGQDEIAELHRAIYRASDDLNQAAKQKQKVALMLSHDLRSPLTSIQGNIALVSNGIYGELSPEAVKRLELAENSVEKLVLMISEFLEAEKLKSAPIHLEETDFGKLYDQTMQMLAGTTGNTKVICRGSDCKLTVDTTLMVRVLTNLIANAMKFSPPNGTIMAAAEHSGDGVEILISDEGPGIPEELQGTIFEPFVQTPDGKRVPKSSGLGLSICKDIVVQHGGQIGVKNNDGAGTTFSIWLPKHI